MKYPAPKDKLVLVTGGSRGIGAAVCHAAAREGYRVAINFVASQANAECLANEIEACGGSAILLKADVSDETQIVRMFKRLDAAAGRITHLVNNVGQSNDYIIEHATSALIEASLRLNFASTVLCSREAIFRMSTRHGGSGGVIVNVSSRAAVLGGLRGRVMYAAAKGAIDSFTIGLAKEVGPDGIRVNAVRPGATITDTHRDRGGVERLNELTASIALGRPGKPEEIANAILFLMSERASYMAGAIMDVSGGR